MRCDRCGCEISEDESYNYLGQTLCEDCYIDIRYPPKTCDPWAVYSATRSRESLGLKEAEGLTDLQKTIYEFIKSKEKVSSEEVMENLNISQPELQTQLAILRHCELIRGHKEGDKVYLIPFS